MNNRMLKAIVKKDLKDIFRSKSLLSTLIIIPIIFSVIFPTILLGSAVFFDIEKLTGEDARKLVETFMTQINSGAVTFESIEQQFVYITINYLAIIFFFFLQLYSWSCL